MTDLFAKEALDAHNKYRKRHNVSPLELDSNLSRQAAAWADYLASNEILKYSNGLHESQLLGENLARIKKDEIKSIKIFTYIIIVFTRSVLI